MEDQVTVTSAVKNIDEVPLEERQKRMSVFAKARQTVLVKFFAMGPLPGLPKKERIESAIDLVHATEAQERNLNPAAYRERKPDTGYCLFQKEQVVTITGLVQQLHDIGLHYIGGHWQTAEGKGPVSTLNFSSEGTPVPIPDAVRQALNSAYNHCTIWCNLRYAEDGDGQFRLDTITVAKRLKPENATHPRRLLVTGNTYRLV